MRAAELLEPFRFELIDSPIEDPRPGEIQVRVSAVGICGSDLHYYSEGKIGDTPCVYPMVLGHEPAGVVARLGDGVTGWTPGDRAVLEPALYCYHCEFCLSGRHNVCANLRFLSMPGNPGFFRELVNLPVHNLLPLPANLSAAEGTLCEPLAVVLHSMHFVALRPAETVAVFGAGPIGLLTLAVLKLSGARRIWAIEPDAHRRELALRLGADAAFDPAGSDPVREILRETGGRGVDAAIDCAGGLDVVNQCLHVTRNAGRVVVTAIPSEERLSLEFHVLRRKEIALYSVRRSNHDTALALRLLTDQPGRFTPVLTHSRPLAQIGAAFELAHRHADGAGKVVVDVA